MYDTLSTIGESTNDCAENYICDTSLYLVSMLSQAFSIIVDHGIRVPGNDREVLDGINVIVKRFLFQLMSTVQLPSAKHYDTKIVIHNGTHTYDVSLARYFQKHLSNAAHKRGVVNQGKYKKGKVNKSGQKGKSHSRGF